MSYTKGKCPKCNDTGWIQYDWNHSRMCDGCCTHPDGWWDLTPLYGSKYIEGGDNGCCKRGCGTMRRDIAAIKQAEGGE